MTDSYELHDALPELDEPILVGMLTGWIDASSAAAAALAAVEAACESRRLATFDGDTFIDYRARRPTLELREGVSTRVIWPDIDLRVGRDPSGRDVVTLSGPEPDSAWRLFADVVTDLAIELGVKQAVFMGAYPFASPHTRPPRLSTTSPSSDVIGDLPFLRNSVDVPAGIAAILEHRFMDKGVPSLGIWAQVPHYLGTMSYPAASAALLDGLKTVTGSRSTRRRWRTRRSSSVSGWISSWPATTSTSRWFASWRRCTTPPSRRHSAAGMSQRMPSGDELAAEIERFLRTQGPEA